MHTLRPGDWPHMPPCAVSQIAQAHALRLAHLVPPCKQVETSDGKAAAEVASKLSLERLNAEFKALDVPAALSVEVRPICEAIWCACASSS